MDYAVNASAFGAFLHQGQICMSSRRILVERPVADEFVEKLTRKTSGLKVGDPKEHDTIIGPLINRRALEMVGGRVADAVAQGARVLTGGEAVGPCFQPTLLADVPADSEFAREETFGPVASIEIVDSADEAVERANATRYGLSADSGWGRFGGRAAMDEFTELRWITVQSGTRPFPLLARAA